MPESKKKPEVIVFAGPNGSGKSTVTKLAKTVGIYINADDIRTSTHCSDLEAAALAEKLREQALEARASFTFETVLSTDRNLRLLERAGQAGYFVRGIYVLTKAPRINVLRIQSRVENGGHGVPPDRIVPRYHDSLANIPRFIAACDVCHIYDNTEKPFRIYKKRKERQFVWPSEFWSENEILALIGHGEEQGREQE
jgi:predicted ABC-type ATPase